MPDFTSFKGLNFKERDEWLSSIKLDPNHFTDTGFRNMLNVFEKQDHWYWPSVTEDTFTSTTVASVDTWSSDRKCDNRTCIADIWFRNHVNKMNHTRIVIQFEEFLGRIGGIFGIVLGFIHFLFGDYVNFEAKLRWIQKFYRFNSNDKASSDLKALLNEDK